MKEKTCAVQYVVVVVVFFTLTDRASTIPIYVVANPVRGQKEVPRSTGHIMVTTRYSDQQGSKSRQKIMRLYKRSHRPITKRFIKPPLLHIEISLDRLGLLSTTHGASVLSNKSDKYVPTSFDQQFQVSQGHTSYKSKKN